MTGHSRSTNQTRPGRDLAKGWRSLRYSLFYSGLYLTAIVAANLLVAQFGKAVVIANAIVFIGLDLTTRDHLHEAWKEHDLVWKMGLLIGAGSVLSWVLNRDAGQIALASFVAFACAGIADAVVYHLLGDKAKMLKINGSNMVSAGVDSAIFPALAFGFPLQLGIMAGQFVAKVCGGFVWSLILRRFGK